MKNLEDYLHDLLHELEDIAAFTVEGKAAFLQNRLVQKGVIRSYEVIGEIVKRLPADFLEQQPQIDWRKLKRFRDFLAHTYEEIALKRIWEAVEDVPALKSAIEYLLTQIPPDIERMDDSSQA